MENEEILQEQDIQKEVDKNKVSEQVDNQDVDIESSIRKDEARLSLLIEEYNSMADKIHDEFESILENNPTKLFTEEELETLESDSNIALKNKMLRNSFEKFRDEKLKEKQEIITKFETELNGRKEHFDIELQSKKFSKDYPKVDMDDFGEFIQEDLTIRQRRELIENSKTKYDFLVGAYELYKKAKGIKDEKKEDETEEFPPDLNDLNGTSANTSLQKDEEENNYLRQIGAIR